MNLFKYLINLLGYILNIGMLILWNSSDSCFHETKRKFDNEDGERQIKYASELPYSKKWKQYVPNTGDFNQYGVEFMIDPLSIGSYILLAYDSSESKIL
ncbi:MAG: hypothetical protein IPI31_03245 [Bacteroidetes bacterium]|nr:hypothetical protein [Bacteroidota bacterium]